MRRRSSRGSPTGLGGGLVSVADGVAVAAGEVDGAADEVDGTADEVDGTAGRASRGASAHPARSSTATVVVSARTRRP
jgi:hypothetical protein